MTEIKNKINNGKIINLNNDEVNYHLKKISEIYKKIDKHLNELILSENNGLVISNEVENIANYLKENKLNLEEIPLNIANGDKEIEKLIIKINNILLNIGDIYKRIKLNLTFKINLELIKLKKEIIPILENIKTIEKINNNINYINLNNEFDKMEKEINECNKKLFIFEREKLFKDINQENFINVIINEFKNNELIDISEKEIMDFYLYIYLFKNDIYDEKSFKFANGL